MTGPTSLHPLVLVVDDEPRLPRALDATLASHGFRCVHSNAREPSVTRAVRHAPDLVIVDAKDRLVDGVSLTAHLRSWTRAPILVLVAGARSSERTALLDAGANACIAKPFSDADLVSRMHVWLGQTEKARRSSPDTSRGRVKVGRDRKSIVVDGRQVHVTPLEYRLLVALGPRRGTAVSEEKLVSAVWGRGSATRERHLRALIRQLRAKIEPDPARPRHLLDEPGGYRLAVGDPKRGR